MLRRHGLLFAVLGGVLFVLVAGGVVAYLTLLRAPGDISHPEVPFKPEGTPTSQPTPTPAPEEPSAPAERPDERVSWPRYGYTLDHRRAFQPPAPITGPYKRMWRRRAPALLEFPPSLADGMLYQMADNGELAAIDKDTGRVRWKRRFGSLAASTPAVDGGTVYATLLETRRGDGHGRILAVQAENGHVVWSRTLPSRTESSPLVQGGKVVIGSEDGTVYALGSHTGRIIWRYRAFGAVKGSPTFSNGLLYFGDYGGHVQAVRAETGRRVWQSGAATGLLRGGTFYATAAVAFGRVFIGSTDGREYSFSATDGRLAWAKQTGHYVYSSAAVENVPGLGPTVFFGSYDGSFYALNARTGKVRWRYRSGGKISGSPTIVGSTVYFADLGRGMTFGLNVRSGHRVFSFHGGGYDPIISDGRQLFLSTQGTLNALLPRRVAQAEARAKRQAEREARKHRKAEQQSKRNGT